MRFLLAAVSLLAVPAAAQVPPDQFFNSNDVQIRYVDQGSGEPVLLIHGYTASVETNWLAPGVFQSLAKDHRVIAFDLRGHGKSGKPHDPAMYGREMVHDAIRLLDHLNIRRAHIVGYSLGAIITAKLLTTNPDRFLSATLGGHAGYRNWKPEYDRSAERYAQELDTDVPFRGLVIAMTPSDQPKPGEDEIRVRSAALAAVNDVKALAAYYRRWHARTQCDGRRSRGAQSARARDYREPRQCSEHEAAPGRPSFPQARRHRRVDSRG